MESIWVFIALFLGTAPFALFGATPEELEATLSYRLGMWGVVYTAFIWLALLHRQAVWASLQHGRVILALTALTTLSAAWSAAPATTLSASAALWATTLIAFYMAARVTPRKLLQILAVACGLLALGSLMIILMLPGYGVMSGIHEGLWNGLTTHKNALGRYMMIGVAASLALALQTTGSQRVLMFALAALCLMLMLGTESATAYVLLISFLLLYLLLRLSSGMSSLARIALFIVSLCAVASAGLLLTDPGLLEQSLSVLGRDPTFTHRTRIWAVALDAIREQPWLGYGYESFWTSSVSAGFSLHYTSWTVPHVHNGFLEIWLGLGLGGLILAVLPVTALLLGIRQHMNADMQALFAIVLTTSLVLNLVEFNFLRYNNIFWILFIYVLLRLKAEARTA